MAPLSTYSVSRSGTAISSRSRTSPSRWRKVRSSGLWVRTGPGRQPRSSACRVSGEPTAVISTCSGTTPALMPSCLRRQIGSQLQESALPDRIKVWEALDLFSSLVPSGQPWEIVMDQWGLSPKRDAKFGNLSGGQQQRLFVALAVVNAPRLVFFDEMTTGLDPMSRRVTWDLVRQVRDQGTTVVLVTHFMDEAEELCDRIAVINEKRVVAIDTPDGLIEEFGGGATVTFSTDAADLGFLDLVEEVDGVSQQGRRVTVTGYGALLVNVAAALVAHGLKPIDLASHRASLEDVFLTITGEER